jgi:hypothetical protein
LSLTSIVTWNGVEQRRREVHKKFEMNEATKQKKKKGDRKQDASSKTPRLGKKTK